VCKRFNLILGITKQLYIPQNPLLARFSGYMPEIQSNQGFCAIKELNQSSTEIYRFAKILA
jgi:hypothetical protein